MMEFVVWSLVAFGIWVLCSVGFVFRKDIKALSSRVYRIVRANVNHKKGVKDLLPLDDKKAREEWQADFDGKIVEVETGLKHQIIRTDYYKAYNGELWPRVTCKCGYSYKSPTTRYETFEATERDALRNGESHVRSMNKAEERVKKTNGDFAF